MRPTRAASLLVGLTAGAPLIGTLACGAVTVESVADSVAVQVSLRLRGETAALSAPMARVAAWGGRDTLRRAQVYVKGASVCALEQVPETTCRFQVARGDLVTLLAAEGTGAVDGDLRAPTPSDTARSTRYLQFVDFAPSCAGAGQRGRCFIRADSDLTVEADFRYMTQIVVYQIGAAALDFYISSQVQPLTFPGDGGHNLNGLGCPYIAQAPVSGCDNVRDIGGDAMHRLTVLLPHGSVLLLLPFDGAGTFFRGWDGPCIPSSGGLDCLFTDASADSVGTPIVLTLRYEYWQCPDGVHDQDEPPGTCTLVRPD